ncbi:MAG TPA: hypothetical protein VEZ90_14845 [Blastocatellia bacterium]|nr:hypothetical protein [Blastocatellia bacterium]
MSTTEAFSQTLISAGAAGGLIKVEGCEPDLAAPHRWPEKDVTLSAFLDTITGENPWYRWELTDGALDLVPSSGDPALLRTRITHIHLRSVVLNNAIHQIISLPEVQQAAVNLGLTPGFVTLQGLAPLAGRKTFNLSCKNVTVREALNAAALAEGRGIWAYTEYHCGGKNEYTVDVRAE